MPPLQVAWSANIAFQRSYLPIALFIGATSGIGQATAEAFARATKGNAHIIICGRNRIAGEATIAQFPKPTSSDAIHEFIECDVSLMKNVQHITDSLISRLPKLNYLLVSQGIFTMRGSDRTSEDMERKLALHYYSRWKFIHDLAPLLKKATDSGEDAKVMSVYAPGLGGKVIWDDLGLKNNFSAFVLCISCL
ncbi:hypothetical protein C8Q75DRAFT_781813 [Abortiporus biennis]|nr:hypothetical protein C8Q75DRAFT_781813 [Abortiporus biennis]